MNYIVSNSNYDPFYGSFLYPFIYGTGDVEITLQCDVNIALTGPIEFFNSVKSVKINSNGYKCIINNYGFIFKDIDKVEVSFLTIYNFNGDGIQLNNVKEYKVSNCTFVGHVSKNTDEAISSVSGAGSIKGEICWCLFSNINKGILCGTGDKGDEELDVSQNIFIHHNWFFNFERRAPYCRYGKYYIYNNIFENWKYKDTQTFCIWSENNAEAFILDNSFKQKKYNILDGFPFRQFSWATKRPWCMNQGVKCFFGGKAILNNNYKNKSWIKLEGDSSPFTVILPEYEKYSPSMEEKIQKLAGSHLL